MPATTAGECQSHPLCRVQPITFHRSRAPVYSPNLNDPCTRCLSQPTTLSRSLTISLYALSHCLALSRSHTESRSLSHQLIHGFFLCQRLTPSRESRFIPHTSDLHLIVCRATGQFYTEPRTVRRTTQRTGSTHCCCSNCCCTHTVLPTTAALLMHHTAHRSSHQPLLH